MNCLVLGAAGFLGRHLCRTLIGVGHEVIGFDLGPEHGGGSWPEIPGVRWLGGDFTAALDWTRLPSRPDCVFHLLCTSLPESSNRNPAVDLQDNVVSTLNFLQQLIDHSPAAKVIFISSGGTVYGIPRTLPIAEDHPTEPLCAYGISKLAIEKYLALFHCLYGLDYRILRVANPYGSGQHPDRPQGVIPVFLSRILAGKTLEIWGDGQVVRDYLYLDDLSAALLAVLSYNGEERIFNIGSGLGTSLNTIVDVLATVTGQPVQPLYCSARKADVPSNVLSIKRARRELGWQPRVSLMEGCRRLYADISSGRGTGACRSRSPRI